jgi:hypothetical protein
LGGKGVALSSTSLAGPGGGLGTMRGRSLLAGAKTPAYFTGIAPRLRELMADYAATGLPPAYLPQHDATDDVPEDS